MLVILYGGFEQELKYFFTNHTFNSRETWVELYSGTIHMISNHPNIINQKYRHYSHNILIIHINIIHCLYHRQFLLVLNVSSHGNKTLQPHIKC